MAEVKSIICLANSRKHSERCVAGIDVDTRAWLRPVSSRPGHGVSILERRLPDGADPQVLDALSIGLQGAQPDGFQSENWLLDADVAWQKVGRADWNILLELEEQPPSLWINESSSSNGRYDRVSEEVAAGLTSSLALIRTTNLAIRVQYEYNGRVVRAHFHHAGTEYALRVTDPVYEQAYLAKPDGTYQLGEAFLTVSLGEPFDGYVYKMVAAIIQQAQQ